MKKLQYYVTWSWIVLTAALSACAVLPLPAQASQTLSPEELDVIIAWTAAAARTQTAVLLPPSPTPTLTLTPSPTPTPATPTATFIFLLPTITSSPTQTTQPIIPNTGGDSGNPTGIPDGFTGRPWTCGITDRTALTVSPRETFFLSVTLRNTGTKVWDHNSVDFLYRDGYRHDGKPIQDLPVSVSPGDTVTLRIQVTAPRDPGEFDLFWDLKVGKQSFCGVKLSFEVR